MTRGLLRHLSKCVFLSCIFICLAELLLVFFLMLSCMFHLLPWNLSQKVIGYPHAVPGVSPCHNPQPIYLSAPESGSTSMLLVPIDDDTKTLIVGTSSTLALYNWICSYCSAVVLLVGHGVSLCLGLWGYWICLTLILFVHTYFSKVANLVGDCTCLIVCWILSPAPLCVHLLHNLDR